MPEVRITLLTRPACSLCGPVRRRVEAVAARTGATWEELDIDQDPDLHAAYTALVPVVLVDGQQFSHWQVDEDALVRAVRRRQRPRSIRRLLGG